MKRKRDQQPAIFKTTLQELCQKRAWRLPHYETTREGRLHSPRFSSTVTVNGMSFRSSSPTRSSKLAQNAAAMVAVHHFSKPSPSPNSIPEPIPEPTFYLPNLSSLPQPSLCAPSGSPASSTNVDNILPTNRVWPPNLEEACQTSLINSPGTTVKDIMTARDQKNMLHLYKNQLQSFAEKRNLNLPVYSSEWEGPLHAMRFKGKVRIDGQTYESPNFYFTLNDAEHAAAEVALMSLSLGRVQEDHTGLYKNLLQELVQKERFHIPIYCTSIYGEAHKPIFVSQVKVKGELFTGQEAKSKKQAEMSAAKVAYTTLNERKAHQGQDLEFSPASLEANVITGLQHYANPKSSVSAGLVIKNQPNKAKGKSDQSSLFSLSAHRGQAPDFLSNHSELNVITGLQHNANPKSLVIPGLFTRYQPDEDKLKKGLSSSGNTNGYSEDSSISNDKPVHSFSDSTNVASETSKMSSTPISTSLCRKKIVVYSNKTNVKIEDGGTLMLNSDDDKWVAYSYSP